MELTNSTPFPAQLLVGSTGDEEQLAIIACKVTYRLENGWLVPVEADEAWPVFDHPFVYENVTLGPELDYRKKGIDIIVFGPAVAPRGEPCRQMLVGISCGKTHLEAAVFGDRVWEKKRHGIVPSEPQPFTEMPLTVDRAFGGKPAWDGIELPHNVNPDGKGYYLTADMALNQPLPNIERTGAIIQTWKDHPLPLCFFRPLGLPIDISGAPPDPAVIQSQLVDRMYNQTVAELVATEEDLGDRLRLVGFSADGEMVFPMPPREGPTAHAFTGSLRSVFPSSISTIVVLAPQRALVVTYLCLFRYLFRPMEKRGVELKWSADAKVPPVDQGGRRHA